MSEHSAVADISALNDPSNYVYRLHRTRGHSSIVVHLSDEYHYSMQDYYRRPDLLKAGGFVVVARPEAGFDSTIVEIAAADRVGIGQIGKLMGALNLKDHWNYRTKEERELEKRGRRR